MGLTSTERSRKRRERLRREATIPKEVRAVATPEEEEFRTALRAAEARDPVARFLNHVQALAHPTAGPGEGARRPSADTMALAQRAAALSERARAIRAPMVEQSLAGPVGLVVPGQGGEYRVTVRESDITRMAYHTLDVILAALPSPIPPRDIRTGLRAALAILQNTSLTYSDVQWADFYAAQQSIPWVPSTEPLEYGPPAYEEEA